jgi:hypothetical protein
MMQRSLLLTAAVALVLLSCGDDDSTGSDDSTDSLEFTIEATTAPGSGPAFTATGPAVEGGMLCADGDATPRPTLYADTGLPETVEDPPQDGDVLWVTFDFTCSDGSGDFALQTEVTVDSEDLESVIQTGEYSSAEPFSLVEGTGSYQDVQMNGERQFAVVTVGGFDDGVVDLFTGTMNET